jgi:hypothetical protein
MIGERHERMPDAREGSNGPETEVAEVAVLLTHWQVHALESAAHRQGLTTGQALRVLIEDYLRQDERRPPLEAG